MLRFAGFELDRQRAELRGPDGEAIKLRPQTFALLSLFAANAGRALSKRELMDVVWPNVHVGDDSLFKCIRELRTALGDDRRQLIKLISGHGYRLDAEATSEPAGGTISVQADSAVPVAHAAAEAGLAKTRWSRFVRSGPAALAAVTVLGAVFGLAIAAPMFVPDLFKQRQPVIAVMPIVGADTDAVQTAATVTIRVADGLTKIENIRVVVVPEASSNSPQAASTRAAQADFVLSGELRRTDASWELRARLTRAATQEAIWSAPVSVAIGETDLELQHSRLAAGLGHLLALRLNELEQVGAPAAPTDGAAKVAVEQTIAHIKQTSKERFAAAQTMLEKSMGDHPDNVDVQVALAALQLRGIQLMWYSPADAAAAETKAKSMLERALRTKPNSIPVLEAYCRFLNATNHFTESLVACARTLTFDPWNGLALYHIGLAQLQLGRFEDALATFKQADRFDTPQVSRWTWLLGAGMTLMLMDRSEEALPWLQKSLAITPGSGRTYMLLSAAHQKLGQPAESKAAMARGLELRPGSNLSNVALPPKNASPIFIAAAEWIGRAYVAAGLPEH